jgi:ACR3 family arsenite transporter
VSGVISKVAKHVRRYLIAYVILAILCAVALETYHPFVSRLDRGSFSLLIESLAITTVFPSMILLKGEELPNSARKIRHILIALSYAYVIMPLIALGLSYELGDPFLGAGYVTANVVPSSSAALGYVLISGGSVELATIFIVIFVILSPVIIPAYLYIVSSVTSVNMPLALVLKSLLIVLIIPLVVGQAIRFAVRRRHEPMIIDRKLRPILSLITMLSMLAIVYFLIARKATLILKSPWVAAEIIIYQTLAVLALILLSLPISKLLGICYEEHQAIIFPSITKNESVAAAIAASSLGGKAALPPALIPMIQPVLAIAYIHMEKFVMRVLRGRRS